jgi:hypothetical protein
MSTIISFITNIKLTVTQWVMVCMATVIAVLVTICKIQGSSLHKAQVDLLRATFGAAMTKQDAIVDAARKSYLDALAEYEGNK